MRLVPIGLLAAALCLGACGDVSEQRMREIVHDYLMENPEVIREALIELQTREQTAAREETRVTALAALDEIVSDPRVPVIGPDDARITIVEFFDYNCSFCKVAAGWLEEAMENHPGDIRVVFRDYPILDGRTGSSVEAAKAALAAADQGLFYEMHFGLYEASGALTSEQIDEIAREAGVDVARMRADMESGEYEELIADTLVLGQRIGVEGTPYFMVGDRIVPGADLPLLESSLAALLAES